MTERLVRVLMYVTGYMVADLYLVKNFHLHKITDKRKKLLGLLVWSIMHLQLHVYSTGGRHPFSSWYFTKTLRKTSIARLE